VDGGGLIPGVPEDSKMSFGDGIIHYIDCQVRLIYRPHEVMHTMESTDGRSTDTSLPRHEDEPFPANLVPRRRRIPLHACDGACEPMLHR